MGVRRTGDRAMGLAAVIATSRLLVVAALVSALAGCKAVPEIAGVIGGGIAGGASGNLAVGLAVGIAVDAVTDATVRYVGRSRHQAEQDAIAEAAAGLGPNGVTTWRIRHDIPIGDEQGQLRVVRDISTPLAACKEIVFSVDDGASRSWYTASICRQAERWKWATAEPAVERWGALQ